mmetsp:Transcript_99746/g.297952  ORF Transcript_99746/g.297952 Transcript_99746/m.297952 type:complete len:378 (+) Transcript_99746:478-1611(+)
MVAPAAAEDLGAHDVARTRVAEDVVDAPPGVAIEDVDEVLPEPLYGRGGGVGVEVTDKDEEIAGDCFLAHQPQQVVRGGVTSAHAPGVHREGPVVVHEEGGLARLHVLQAHPLGAPFAVPLRGHVLRHVFLAVRQQLPARLGVGHADGVGPLEGDEVLEETLPREHPLGILALLEPHEIERLGLVGPGDELAGTVAVAPTPVVEVPPEKVVRQDLHLHGGARLVSCPQRGYRAGGAPLAFLRCNPCFVHCALGGQGDPLALGGDGDRGRESRGVLRSYARPGALLRRVHMHRLLELHLARRSIQTRIPLRMLLDALPLRPLDVIPTGLTLNSSVAIVKGAALLLRAKVAAQTAALVLQRAQRALPRHGTTTLIVGRQ